ncbi:MAG: hypothetical protein FH756_00385 [Firmicutes bacterium]|nr:hypothetical protein [Bacillota bacterium]
MKELIRRTVREERGDALLFFLFIVPLILSLILWRMDYSQAVTHTEIDFTEGLKKAVKAAANQVTERSQAEGDPRIDSDRAHAAFRAILADNLKLDSGSMAPINNSPLKSPVKYTLVVYNGDDNYIASGAKAVYQYDFDGNTLSSYPLSGSGFPQQFTVTDSGIAYGTGGTFDVVLDAPGCVAVAEVDLKTITDTPAKPVRWASTKIHNRSEEGSND